LSRCVAVYGEVHNLVSNCYQAIAQVHFINKDLKEALEAQEKA
jgi:hypothetical protein